MNDNQTSDLLIYSMFIMAEEMMNAGGLHCKVDLELVVVSTYLFSRTQQRSSRRGAKIGRGHVRVVIISVHIYCVHVIFNPYKGDFILASYYLSLTSYTVILGPTLLNQSLSRPS